MSSLVAVEENVAVQQLNHRRMLIATFKRREFVISRNPLTPSSLIQPTRRHFTGPFSALISSPSRWLKTCALARYSDLMSAQRCLLRVKFTPRTSGAMRLHRPVR